MYNLSRLLEDVANQRGRLQAKQGASASPPDYAEVWGAFGGYALACLSERRGLHLPQLCKLGWRTDRKSKGNASVKPFLQFTEQFCRAYLSPQAVKKHQQNAVAEKDANPVEEFNFSKAAIKYSQQLTKDQMLTGLKGIVQQLGEAVADGKDGEIVLGNVGRFRISGAGREPTFQFSGEVYSIEGQRPPPAAAPPAKEDTAAAFSKDMPREAVGLGIRGTNAGTGLGDAPSPAPDATAPAFVPAVTPQAPPQEQEAPARLASSASAPQLGGGAPPQPTNTALKQGFAYKEAMERHVKALEMRAAETVAEHDAWNSHVSECIVQEREEIMAKRCRAQENLQLLQSQMAQAEERKKTQRKADIEAASAHEFPIMAGQAREESKKEITSGMQQRLRADLDAQVRTNNTLRNLAKQRERAIEIDHLDNLRSEMTNLRSAERAKKAYEVEALRSAWNSDVRLHNISKAIDNHAKAKGSHIVAQRSPTPLVPASMEDALPFGGGVTPMGSAGRLMTGSQRRVPMGASNSLGQLETRLSTAGSQRY